MISPLPHLAELAGLTPFVAPEALERQLGVTFRARLGANENVFGAAPEAIAAMSDAARLSHHYGDPQSLALREHLVQLYGGNLDNYVFGGGIDGLMISLSRAFVGPGHTVATTLGSYPTFEYAIRGTGATLLRVPYLADGTINTTELANSQADILYIACPDNPSGSLTSPKSIRDVLDAMKPESLLVLDEAYADFLAPADQLPVDFSDPRLIRLRTFSKAHGMAGKRIGYAMGHASLIEPLSRVRPHFEVNSVAQAGALASLQHPAHVQSVVAQVAAARQELADLLRRHGLTPLPSHTNFVSADVGSKEAADALLAGLLRAGVFIRKPALPPLDRCIRITVGRAEDLQFLDEALQSLTP